MIPHPKGDGVFWSHRVPLRRWTATSTLSPGLMVAMSKGTFAGGVSQAHAICAVWQVLGAALGGGALASDFRLMVFPRQLQGEMSPSRSAALLPASGYENMPSPSPGSPVKLTRSGSSTSQVPWFS